MFTVKTPLKENHSFKFISFILFDGEKHNPNPCKTSCSVSVKAEALKMSTPTLGMKNIDLCSKGQVKKTG